MYAYTSGPQPTSDLKTCGYEIFWERGFQEPINKLETRIPNRAGYLGHGQGFRK